MSNFLDMSFTQEELNDSQKDEYAVIPKGDYMAEITRTEIKDFEWKNSGAHGKLLSMMFKVIDGEYTGRVIFADAHLSNSEYELFVSQGRKLIAQVALACNIKQLNDSQQMHDKPLMISVAIEVDKKGQYDDKNVIKKVSPLAAGTNPKFTAKPHVQSAPQAQQPVDDRPAWQRG